MNIEKISSSIRKNFELLMKELRGMQFKRTLPVALGGMFGAIVLAFVYLAIHLYFNFDAYNHLLGVSAPIGALVAGVLIAFAFRVGLSASKYSVDKEIFVYAAITSVFTHLLIHFLYYINSKYAGKPASEIMSFMDYLNECALSVIRSRPPTNANVGSTYSGGGYYQAVYQMACMYLTSVVFYFYFARVRECETCGGLLKTEFDATLYTDDLKRVRSVFGSAAALINQGRFQSATAEFERFGDVSLFKTNLYRARLTVRRCSNCFLKTVELYASEKEKRNWVFIPKMQASNSSKETILNEKKQ